MVFFTPSREAYWYSMLPIAGYWSLDRCHTRPPGDCSRLEKSKQLWVASMYSPDEIRFFNKRWATTMSSPEHFVNWETLISWIAPCCVMNFRLKFDAVLQAPHWHTASRSMILSCL